MCSPTYIICGHVVVYFVLLFPTWVCLHNKIRMICLVLIMHFLRGQANVYVGIPVLGIPMMGMPMLNICIIYNGLSNAFCAQACRCNIYAYHACVILRMLYVAKLMFNIRGHAHGGYATVKYACSVQRFAHAFYACVCP